MMEPDDPDPPKKKIRTENKFDPPPYGSKKYWNDRYERNNLVKITADGLVSKSTAEPSETEENPYHSWYFSYADLKPLIMPLIVGGQIETYSSDEDSNRDDDLTSDAKEAKHRSGAIIQDEENSHQEQAQEDQETVYFEEEIEIVEKEDDEQFPERIGVARDKAVSVLEIGCGDVPLGKELAIDLLNLQHATKINLKEVVKQIICSDYSSAVISMMISEKQVIDGLRSDDLEVIDRILQFQVVDARKIPHENESFEILLEKGTLDAMLSDKVHGISNCQAIMAECGRVLAIGGYLVLISHLNAHTSDGIDWLNQVVLEGLQSGSKNMKWEIEVHGNEVDDSSSENPGPCVYIIQKLEKATEENVTMEDEEQTGLHLRFFSY